MTALTRKREALLEQLIELAGDPLIVQRALRELNSELPAPPTVEQLVRRIFELKTAAARQRRMEAARI
jgi:hypothetical protein